MSTHIDWHLTEVLEGVEKSGGRAPGSPTAPAKAGDQAPVPVRVIDCGTALVASSRVAVAAPAAGGVKLTLSGMLTPGWRVNGNASGVKANPPAAPTKLAPVTVSGAEPTLVTFTFWGPLATFTAWFSNVRVPGVSARVPA